MGGHAGDVTVQSSAEIVVNGLFANGIYASSSGGTGGINGDGTGGDGGSVTVSVTGPVSTFGEFADAVYAESTGGLGAINGNGSGGDAGAVSVFVSGDVTANGESANGIRARSAAGVGAINGGGPDGVGSSVQVEIGEGAVQGGSGSAFGVVLDAVTDAVLSNSGNISALSGRALFARGQSIEVSNFGAMSGNVEYANDTDGIFSNFAGGEVFSGDSVNLNGGTFTNYGIVAPGGHGTVQTTFLNGNFNQPSGSLVVDADWDADAADVIEITGAAELAGSVAVNPLHFPDSSDPGNVGLIKTFEIFRATGGITDLGISAVDTAAVDYELLFPNTTTMSLQATINFLGVQPEGLTPNQAAAGAALNALVEGGGNASFVSPLLGLGTQEELGSALDQLTPAGDAAQISSAMKTGSTFAGQLLSCRTLGEGDPNAFIREGQCLWVRANVRQLDNDGRNGETGFDETATFYSAGAQFDLGGPWRFGAGIGFEDGDLRTGSNAQSETERLHLGGVIKYNPGPLLLAASLTGGHGWSDNTRVISFGGFSDVATSESDQSFISGRLTAAYLLSHGHWYAKPQVDLGWTHLERDAYVEQSSGGTALAVGASDDTVFSISPSIEFGAQYALAFGGVARPYVKAGVTWHDADSFVTSAAFQGVPPGTGGFEIVTTIDDVVADLGLGVDFLAESGTVLRVQYDGQFGDQTEQHGGSAKLSVPF
ncbi:MAG: autotransporter outer membrane beta-barrel domain-containing protein [Hyphomonas sp.]|nr:autotransporter outer membrane beta-barrel domain-containing protein [Hyphomonas sp.]